MISEEDKEKMKRLQTLESLCSWRRVLIPLAFPVITTVFLIKWWSTGINDNNFASYTLGVVGLGLGIMSFLERKKLLPERNSLKEEMGL